MELGAVERYSTMADEYLTMYLGSPMSCTRYRNRNLTDADAKRVLKCLTKFTKQSMLQRHTIIFDIRGNRFTPTTISQFQAQAITPKGPTIQLYV